MSESEEAEQAVQILEEVEYSALGINQRGSLMQRRCRHCGERMWVLPTSEGEVMFCSQPCAKAWSKAMLEVQKDKVQLPKTCKNPDCRRDFTPRDKNQHYCGPKCRSSRYEVMLEHRRVCAAPGCEVVFSTSNPAKRYHSHTCADRVRRERKKNPPPRGVLVPKDEKLRCMEIARTLLRYQRGLRVSPRDKTIMDSLAGRYLSLGMGGYDPTRT